MTVESQPCFREPMAEPVYVPPVDLVEMDAEPLLDQTGNVLRDQNGSIVYD